MRTILPAGENTSQEAEGTKKGTQHSHHERRYDVVEEQDGNIPARAFLAKLVDLLCVANVGALKLRVGFWCTLSCSLVGTVRGQSLQLLSSLFTKPQTMRRHVQILV